MLSVSSVFNKKVAVLMEKHSRLWQERANRHNDRQTVGRGTRKGEKNFITEYRDDLTGRHGRKF